MVESYFSERTQSVVIRGVKSEPVPLSQGVPQGSIIGPKSYTMYTKSLGDIIEHLGLQYHIYADDIKIYYIKTMQTAPAWGFHKCTQTAYRDYRTWQLVLSVVVVHVIMLHH